MRQTHFWRSQKESSMLIQMHILLSFHKIILYFLWETASLVRFDLWHWYLRIFFSSCYVASNSSVNTTNVSKLCFAHITHLAKMFAYIWWILLYWESPSFKVGTQEIPVRTLEAKLILCFSSANRWKKW